MKSPQTLRRPAPRGARKGPASPQKPVPPTQTQPRSPHGFSDALSGIIELPLHVSDDDEVGSALKARLLLLPVPWRDKVGVLMNLGRAAHEKGNVYSSVSSGVEASQLDVLALCDKHTRSHQYLERGLALVSAGGLALDQEGDTRKRTVFDRAWSHFGRELAESEPSEWTWFACGSGRPGHFEKLYLRRGKGAWWSFAVALDRPLAAQVGVDRARSMKPRKGDHGSGLHSLAARKYSDRRALRRAVRSVNARLGIMGRQAAASSTV